MVIPQAVASFWRQLDQSGLVPARKVRELARSLAAEGVASDAVVARKLVELGHLTRYQADRLLEGRSRGFFFDKYKLLDLFGIGGMGWVYRAEEAETGRIVALKVLLDHFKNDQGMVVRFEYEARASSKFNHENIVRTFGYGTAGGLPYVVMELVEGPSLLELLRVRERCRLPWQQACDVAKQAAVALHQVHLARFVHRDIKPQNLLIDHAGHVKLLDFGLSMLSEGEEGDEFSMAMIFGHECVGTAAYMAPEQATDSLKADARSDIYGLGCTLFAMLTGDTPFPLADAKETVKAHQSKIPRNVCDVVPSIPKAVGAIVARMLSKDPEARYASGEEVAKVLSEYAVRSPVEFDFDKILVDRNKAAREKLAELQRRQRKSADASSSTARPSAISSVATSTTGAMKRVGLDSHAPGVSSSIARRDPFGFEHPPAIVLRHTNESKNRVEDESIRALESEMVLLPLNGESAIRLNKDQFLIGRGEDCDLQIQDASISTHHCELQFDGHYWTLVDLNSRNGVRVNGDTVKKHLLRAGDTLIIGASLRIRFTSLNGDTVGQSGHRIRFALFGLLALTFAALLTAAAFKFWDLGGQ